MEHLSLDESRAMLKDLERRGELLAPSFVLTDKKSAHGAQGVRQNSGARFGRPAATRCSKGQPDRPNIGVADAPRERWLGLDLDREMRGEPWLDEINPGRSPQEAGGHAKTKHYDLQNDKELCGVVVGHMDDLVFAGDAQALKSLEELGNSCASVEGLFGAARRSRQTPTDPNSRDIMISMKTYRHQLTPSPGPRRTAASGACEDGSCIRNPLRHHDSGLWHGLRRADSRVPSRGKGHRHQGQGCLRPDHPSASSWIADVYDRIAQDIGFGAQKSLMFTVANLRQQLRRPQTTFRWTATSKMFVNSGAGAGRHAPWGDLEHRVKYSPDFVCQTAKKKLDQIPDRKEDELPT